MNQPPLQNPDLQPNKVIESQAVDCCPENDIQGNGNRAIQGEENLGVLGDANTVSQNSNNLNGSGSHFIKNMQADQISFINVTYLEAISEEKLNGSQATVEKKEETNNKGKATFVFTGTIDSVNEKLLKALEAHLRKIAKDTELTILKAEEGSIKITLEASQESLELLKNLFESGELTEVLDIPVEDVQILHGGTVYAESPDEGQGGTLTVKLPLYQASRKRQLFPTSNTITVLVAHDHELTRITLQMVLSVQENIQVVGVASNTQEAIKMVERYHPDVVILNLYTFNMGDWSAAAAHIKNIAPNTQIIAYSSAEDTEFQQTRELDSFDVFYKTDASTTELITLVKRLGQRANSQFGIA